MHQRCLLLQPLMQFVPGRRALAKAAGQVAFPRFKNAAALAKVKYKNPGCQVGHRERENAVKCPSFTCRESFFMHYTMSLWNSLVITCGGEFKTGLQELFSLEGRIRDILGTHACAHAVLTSWGIFPTRAQSTAQCCACLLRSESQGHSFQWRGINLQWLLVMVVLWNLQSPRQSISVTVE